ncbi:MAG: hypothetical protein E7355_04770 [Clostridiales bacterium]|nr:hypothetical protein [Clostridiales bacterium]
MKKTVQTPRRFRFLAYGTPVNANTGWDNYTGNPDYNTPEQWKMMAECGFEYAQPIGYDRTDEHIERSMQAGEAAGVKVFVTDTDNNEYSLAKLVRQGGTYEEAWARYEDNKEEILKHYNKFVKYSSFVGIFGSDEPNGMKFQAIRAAKDWFAENYPGYEYFVNLFPHYAQGWQLFGDWDGREGFHTYEDYVKYFCETVQPDSLSFDHYALVDKHEWWGDSFIKPDFFYNLAVIAKYARKLTKELGKDVPAYVYLQSMGFEGKRNLEDYEMWAWQCYTSLAFGMQGIQAFCYFSMLKDADREGFVISDALVDRFGRKTPTYAYVQRALSDIKKLESVYMSYAWEGTKAFWHGDKCELFKQLEGWEIDTLRDITNVETDGDLLIGQFENCQNTDKKAYMLANANNPYPEKRVPFINVSLHFDGVKNVTVYKPSAKVEKIAIEDGTLRLQIPCGEGYFIEIE